nr:replication factor C subunit 3-like [Tanacetum cinerariifolium]
MADKELTYVLENFRLKMARRLFIRRVANGNELDEHMGPSNAVAQGSKVDSSSCSYNLKLPFAPEISTVNLKPDYIVMVIYDVDKADESIQHLIKRLMLCGCGEPPRLIADAEIGERAGVEKDEQRGVRTGIRMHIPFIG